MPTRPEYANTKAGLIGQVNDYHAKLEAMTADRDIWQKVAQTLAAFISNTWRGDRNGIDEIIDEARSEVIEHG